MQHSIDRYVEAIRRAGLTIYDRIRVGDPTYWIPTELLEQILDRALRGLELGGMPIRTRSKVLKESVCSVLGYPVPKSFKKTKPRFPGQFFDTYVQKSNNLQVWNEELAPSRRYVLVRVNSVGRVVRVKVVTGDTLALLDTTGTLTSKYQAKCIRSESAAELVTPEDTPLLLPLVNSNVDLSEVASPVAQPRVGELLPIRNVFDRLAGLLGRSFPDAGVDQERNRGGTLHRMACAVLGYRAYQDDGQFPDIRHQILEVKLQTSPTIDLGLVRPDSLEALDVPIIRDRQVRHCDVRYAILYGSISCGIVRITHLFVTTGSGFFTRFPQFGGRVLNAKLQIPLPPKFFD